MEPEQRTSNHMERYNVAVNASNGGIRGLATPYKLANGRPGAAWQINEKGLPEVVEYEGTIFEPGTFSEWLEAGNARRVRFLFQHGDASWGGPEGVNALPIGAVRNLTETDDGLEFEAEFASHELAQAVKELIATGALEEVSIAFVVTEYDFRTGDDGKTYRHATAAELYDVSVVVWGQYGLNATITELYNAAPGTRETLLMRSQDTDGHVAAAATETRKAVEVMARIADRYAGASISKANAEVLSKAVDDMRSAAASLNEHADSIEGLINPSAPQGDDVDEADAETKARERLALQGLALIRVQTEIPQERNS